MHFGPGNPGEFQPSAYDPTFLDPRFSLVLGEVWRCVVHIEANEKNGLREVSFGPGNPDTKGFSPQTCLQFCNPMLVRSEFPVFQATPEHAVPIFVNPCTFGTLKSQPQLTTPNWSMTHFDVFLKANLPRFVGKLTSKVNSRSEYATKILLAV